MNRIQELRKEAGFTQAQLAEKLGINAVTLSRYETGDRNPKLDKLEKMSEIFKVSVDYLTGKSDSRLGVGKSWDELSRKINSNDINYNLLSLAKDNDLAKTALLLDFDKLNEEGRKEALKQIKNLSKISDYTE